jgi:hypothetical protein
MPKLPEAVLRKRVQNEIAQVMRKTDHSVIVKDRTFSEWPSVIDVILKDSPGPVKRGDRVTTKYTHKMRVTITRSSIPTSWSHSTAGTCAQSFWTDGRPRTTCTSS